MCEICREYGFYLDCDDDDLLYWDRFRVDNMKKFIVKFGGKLKCDKCDKYLDEKWYESGICFICGYEDNEYDLGELE